MARTEVKVDSGNVNVTTERSRGFLERNLGNFVGAYIFGALALQGCASPLLRLGSGLAAVGFVSNIH